MHAGAVDRAGEAVPSGGYLFDQALEPGTVGDVDRVGEDPVRVVTDFSWATAGARRSSLGPETAIRAPRLASNLAAAGRDRPIHR